MAEEYNKSMEPVMFSFRDRLKSVVDEAILEELNQSNNFTTRATVHLRVLKGIADMMLLPWTMIQDLKPLVPIHRYCLDAIYNLWYRLQQHPLITTMQPLSKMTVTPEELNTVEKFLSRDYARPADLIKCASILWKRAQQDGVAWKNLHKIFAVDGTSGTDIRKYVSNLQYGGDEKTLLNEQEAQDFKAVHVRGIRCLYHEMFKKLENVSSIVDMVSRAVECLWTKEENEWTLIYLQHIGYDATWSSPGNTLDNIVSWKRKEQHQYQYQQQQLQEKKNQKETHLQKNNLKRKLNMQKDDTIPLIKKGKKSKDMSTSEDKSPTAEITTSNDYFDPSIFNLQPVRSEMKEEVAHEMESVEKTITEGNSSSSETSESESSDDDE